MAAEGEDGGAPGLVGKKVGRYEIREELGAGGMAAVYRAFDPQLGREVALKVMHGFLAGRGDIQKRFQREAQAVAALNHDAIVGVHDFAPATGAAPGYIVSELVRGPTLRGLLDERGGRILPEVSALIGARVADALAAAHAHGVVHRDVKPDNVMIDRPGDAGEGGSRVVLADFGVAHVAGMETMTATGAVVGSPAYMSPEQARGEDVGPASDLFSLGVVLYHLCTGRLPFGGKDPLTVIAGILRGELKRPSVLDARVGPEMERVILRCLRPAPADRFADAGEVARGLREVAAAAGLTDGTVALRRFFAAPAELEAELAPRVAAAAFEGARGAVRRGEFGRALAEINRVFAYAPDHAGANALLRSITARRRWVRLATRTLGVASLAALGALGATLTHHASPSSPTPLASPAAVVAAPAVSIQAAPPSPSLSPPRVVQEETRGAERTAPTKPRVRATGVSMPSSIPATVSAVATPSPSPIPIPEPTPIAPQTPSSPAPSSLLLRAQNGWCYPSIDERDAGKSVEKRYFDVSPGQHEIFCTPPGVAKMRAGVLEVRAGSQRPPITIRNENGLPVLPKPGRE